MPFFCSVHINWREGLTILMERGSGSVPIAWRGGAGCTYSVQVARVGPEQPLNRNACRATKQEQQE